MRLLEEEFCLEEEEKDGGNVHINSGGALEAYDTDLEYLEDAFAVIVHRIRKYTTEMEEDVFAEDGRTFAEVTKTCCSETDQTVFIIN